MKFTFRRILFATAIFGTGLFVSCKEETKIENETVGETTETEASSTTSNTDAEAQNPAHGEPGHRCDIPVGAPLSSEPQQKQKPKIQTSRNTANGNVSPVRVNQDTKVNPPHGQPGHDCTKKVGAPL